MYRNCIYFERLVINSCFVYVWFHCFQLFGSEEFGSSTTQLNLKNTRKNVMKPAEEKVNENLTFCVTFIWILCALSYASPEKQWKAFIFIKHFIIDWMRRYIHALNLRFDCCNWKWNFPFHKIWTISIIVVSFIFIEILQNLLIFVFFFIFFSLG